MALIFLLLFRDNSYSLDHKLSVSQSKNSDILDNPNVPTIICHVRHYIIKIHHIASSAHKNNIIHTRILGLCFEERKTNGRTFFIAGYSVIIVDFVLSGL